jgi:RNA polymerase sigma factor (sigma-70 family)
MANGQLNTFIRHLRRVVPLREAGALSDAQLLERFVQRRDEAAFEVLVWRHGSMVLNVCLRVLRREHDAEDAFQATFLALVRKAGAIGNRESVSSWLYKVAYRVALRARTVVPTRSLPEEPLAPALHNELLCRELRSVLDEEIRHLPDKYRAAFVLCHLEGQTTDAAARTLGCPRGTISTRLARARELLRRRLARRGYDLSAPAGFGPVAPVLPGSLVQATVNAFHFGTADQAAAAGAISARVATLTKGAMGAMSLTKISLTSAIILTVGLLGGAILAHRAQAQPAGQSKTIPPAKAPAAEAKQAEVTLRWRFEKDRPFYQELTTTTAQDMRVAGNKVKEFNQTQKQTFVLRWTPLKEERGAWLLQAKFIAVKLDLDIGGNLIQYDSTKEDNQASALTDFYKALVGSEFTITLEKDGKVSKVEERRQLVTKLVEADPQMGAIVRQVLSEGALRQMAETPFAGLPPDAVEPGDSWRRTSKLDMGTVGTYEGKYKYTYEGLDGKLDKIKIRGTLEFQPPAEGGAGPPFKIKKAQLKSDGTGVMLFDRAMGRVVSLEFTQQVGGSADLTNGEQEVGVDLRQKQTTTLHTTDVNPVKQLRAQNEAQETERLREENERLRQENERLRKQLKAVEDALRGTNKTKE